MPPRQPHGRRAVRRVLQLVSLRRPSVSIPPADLSSRVSLPRDKDIMSFETMPRRGNLPHLKVLQPHRRLRLGHLLFAVAVHQIDFELGGQVALLREPLALQHSALHGVHGRIGFSLDLLLCGGKVGSLLLKRFCNGSILWHVAEHFQDGVDLRRHLVPRVALELCLVGLELFTQDAVQVQFMQISLLFLLVFKLGKHRLRSCRDGAVLGRLRRDELRLATRLDLTRCLAKGSQLKDFLAVDGPRVF
mmetsp:Transcript_11323/g.37816  ORF Transcript_11323/g.37816 Transcript_11323/m.37816 type:complete len:247 (+) Transcript_11323:907-1647(+)